MKIVIYKGDLSFDLDKNQIKKYCDLKETPVYFYKPIGYDAETLLVQYKKVDVNCTEHLRITPIDFGETTDSKQFTSKYEFNAKSLDRSDKDLLTVIEASNNGYFKVIEIADNAKYEIKRLYDGSEIVVLCGSYWE